MVDNGIQAITTSQLSDILEAFNISPDNLLNHIERMSLPTSNALFDGIADAGTVINATRGIEFNGQLKSKMRSVITAVKNYRLENNIPTTNLDKPVFRVGGKKKTIRKKSKKTMKRNSKKKGSYKKYKGGNPLYDYFIFLLVFFNLKCQPLTIETKKIADEHIQRTESQLKKLKKEQQQKQNKNDWTIGLPIQTLTDDLRRMKDSRSRWCP